MSRYYHRILIALVVLAAGAVFGLDLVKDGRSAFVIHIEEDAPPSVVEAAADLQAYCQQVTGAKLAIVHRRKADDFPGATKPPLPPE